jgi:4-hydroxy-tetrahydrodipicolinate synthase
MDFGRLVTAMATPFREDGQIDVDGLKVLIDHLIDTGTTALVVCGTTGESPTLSHDEKLFLFEKTLEFANGRVPVIAGTGGNNTAESIRLSKEAMELGVNGLLVVAPYYNRPTQDGLYAHFASIAEQVPLPIMVYNVPPRTAVNIEVGTLLKLAEIPNIVSVKEASGDFGHILRLMAEKPDDLVVYSGDDKFTIPMMSLGAYGVVSVASHVVGPEMTAMMQAYAEGNTEDAKMWALRLLPIFEALFRVTSPAPLKAALRLLGLPAGQVRLPLVDAPEHVVHELERELKRLSKL